MNGEKISRCLDTLPDEMLAEAMKPYKPRSLGRHIFRIAACLAIVIGLLIALWPQGEEPGEQMGMPTVGTTAAPTELPTTLPEVPTAPTQTQGYELVKMSNVLKVYACNTKNVGGENIAQYELSSDKPFLLALWNPLINASNFALPLTFQIPENYFGAAEITFDVCSEYGGFGQKPNDYENYHDQITIAAGNQLYFGGNSLWNAATDIGEGKSFFADIIIYADGTVVGYGVISFCFRGATCYAHEFTTVCFPLVDGEYQEVTEEYVWEQIEEYKKLKAELEEV